ncbi:MAG TPA: alpha/beta fold hydrolase [Syntrophales bacterium]|nr:alpha/beta fold hydrolase [Syntrophales bacterium]HPX56341.1 alpha/beta fold hydrolase [Syntrophales bacterium]
MLPTPTGALSGTIEIPKTGVSSTLVVMISGSGPTDRDGNIQGLQGQNNCLRYLAEALARHGIASLRFDKRGIGKSVTPGLKEDELRFETYCEDVGCWVAYARSRWTFKKLFILGHSEGSLIGMAAARQVEADGFISVSGVGRPADLVILEQTRKQLPPDLMKETESIVAALKSGRTVHGTSPALAPLFRESVQPYLISWFRYDPAQEIAKLDMPVIIIQGTTDIQVMADDARLLHEANRKATLTMIEGMNHVLKAIPPDKSKQFASYGDPSLPVMEELVKAVVKFTE